MFTCTQYATADAFLEQAQPTLLQTEAVNSLILGLALQLCKFPERSQPAPFLLTIKNELQAKNLIALMTPPHNLIITCAACDPAVLNLLADHLLEHHISIPGVLGATPASDQFAILWEQRTACKVQLNRRERAFELRQLIHPPQAPGRLRLAAAAELELLAEWTRAFNREALQEDMALEEAQDLVTVKIRNRQLHVWDDARPVSMAAAARPTLHGSTVNLVYTPPDLRGRGYASNCVAALSQHLLNDGYQFCALFTDLANPTSNKIYQAIGYQPVADFNEYRFESG